MIALKYDKLKLSISSFFSLWSTLTTMQSFFFPFEQDVGWWTQIVYVSTPLLEL